MARYSGPAGRGASRTMQAVRRAEAETRQVAAAAERAEREARFNAELAAAPPLTDEQVDAFLLAVWQAADKPNDAWDNIVALRDAMLRADALEAYRQTRTRGAR